MQSLLKTLELNYINLMFSVMVLLEYSLLEIKIEEEAEVVEAEEVSVEVEEAMGVVEVEVAITDLETVETVITDLEMVVTKKMEEVMEDGEAIKTKRTMLVVMTTDYKNTLSTIDNYYNKIYNRF